MGFDSHWSRTSPLMRAFLGCDSPVSRPSYFQDEPKKAVTMSLRPSFVTDPKGRFLVFSNLKKGMKVKGTVASVTAFGVFVKLSNSEVSIMRYQNFTNSDSLDLMHGGPFLSCRFGECATSQRQQTTILQTLQKLMNQEIW
jgi:hypothetical protein